MTTLTKRAVLVALHVSCWNPRKRDREAAEVVHQHYHATSDSGNYHKTLIDVRDHSWRNVVKAQSELRTYHYHHTLPWSQSGLAILPTAMYLDYHTTITSLCEQYLDAARSFVLGHYERLKEDARRKRNGLFREHEYPQQAALLRRFRANVRFMPVPSSGHVIVDLAESEIARVKSSAEQLVEEAVKQAQAELWQRIYEPLRHMAETLADPHRTFRDSLVGNLREILALAPKLSLVHDPMLTEILSSAQTLAATSPDTLRMDLHKRATTAEKAAQLAAKMQSLIPQED